MRRPLLYLCSFLMSVTSMSLCSCSSSDETENPKNEFVEVDSPYSVLKKKVFALFGLDAEDCIEQGNYAMFDFKCVDASADVSLAVVRKSDNRLVFGVYDTIQSKVLMCDSSFIAQPHVYETYYDKVMDYKLARVFGKFIPAGNGGVGIAQLFYTLNTSRNFLYFLNDGNWVSKDSLYMPSNIIYNSMKWEDDKVLIQYEIDNGYKNVVYDLNGNEVCDFCNNESLADYSFIKIDSSDFVQYRFSINSLHISRKTIENNNLVTKWEKDYIEYPEGFDTHKMDVEYSVSGNRLVFNVSTLCKNGTTKKYVVEVDLETGKNSFEEVA